VGAHARNLQLQGQKPEDVDLIGKGQAEKANLPERERVLLEYVKVLTLEPAKVTDQHVERMRKAGWTDDQIAEASFNSSLFAFFNRMAEAYGLDYADRGWFPPELRNHPTGKPAAPPAPAREAPGTRP
jgi:alkylhydroperoxidase family enzyme